MPDGPLTVVDDSARAAIRLGPRTKADRLVAIGAAAGGGRMLKATVIAPADGRRANKALLQLLARTWHIPRPDLSIIWVGFTSRNKAVRLVGDPQLVEKIMPELGRLPGR